MRDAVQKFANSKTKTLPDPRVFPGNLKVFFH